MPEGSEVKIVGEWLHHRLEGRALGAAAVMSGRYLKRLPRLTYVVGDVVDRVEVKGKLITVYLNGAI